MTNTAFLSVHLLTYNCDAYIEQALQSILNQKTDFKFEIVIGDDHSTDGTPGILHQYAQKYPHIINYKHNITRLGILKNFKETLDRCSGKYIFDISGDDFFKHDQALQKIMAVFKSHPNLGFVESGYDQLFEKTQKVELFSNKDSFTCNKSHYKSLALTGQIYPIGICYNKELLLKHVDFTKYIEMGITIEDYPILADMIVNTDFERIPEVLHTYRVHTKSFSHLKDLNYQLVLNQQMSMLVNYFSKKYKLSPEILKNHQTISNKNKLYLAGYFGEKALGKSMYQKIKNDRSVADYLNYLSSQVILIRKLHVLFRKIQ